MIKYFIGDIYNSQIVKDLNNKYRIIIPNELDKQIDENEIQLLYGKNWKTKMYVEVE